MTDADSFETLATIVPSVPRRFIGITVLSLLGGVLIYLALANPPAHLGWQLFLLVLGAGVLVLADALRRATAVHLVVTREALMESTGRVVAPVAQIERIDRGAFAIKPSNGFLIRLKAPLEGGNHWAPGLWWRLGRRIGVGGITSASESRAAAEILTALAVERYTPE